MYDFVCKTCGKAFQSSTKTRVYCSKACQSEGAKDAQREMALRYYANLENAQPIEKRCEFCGKKFTTKNPRVKYCSPVCRQKSDDAHKLRSEHTNNTSLDRELARLRKQSTINKVLKEAKKQGLSYGQMMARKYERKMNDDQTTTG